MGTSGLLVDHGRPTSECQSDINDFRLEHISDMGVVNAWHAASQNSDPGSNMVDKH